MVYLRRIANPPAVWFSFVKIYCRTVGVDRMSLCLALVGLTLHLVNEIATGIIDIERPIKRPDRGKVG